VPLPLAGSAADVTWSCQQRLDHGRGDDAGELLIEALESERELLVVDAEAVEHRGVQVADVDGVYGDVVAEIVGLAVADARLDAAAGEPGGEALGVVVAAVVLLRQAALAVDGVDELNGTRTGSGQAAVSVAIRVGRKRAKWLTLSLPARCFKLGVPSCAAAAVSRLPCALEAGAKRNPLRGGGGDQVYSGKRLPTIHPLLCGLLRGSQVVPRA